MLFKLTREGMNTEIWVAPAMVVYIGIIDQESAFIYVQGHPNGFRTTTENARALIAQINDVAASQAEPRFVPAPNTAAEIVAMTRDVTKSGGTMWRCATKGGFMVNVFQHDDPLKDSFTHFVTAGYGAAMTELEPGETLNWTKYPIQVELTNNGKFWNVVSVKDRPLDAQFDRPEYDEDGNGEDGSDDDE